MYNNYEEIIEEGMVSPAPLALRCCDKCKKHLLGVAHWRKCGMKSPPWLIGYKEEYVCFDCEPFIVNKEVNNE